jgi:aldehyde oxidoreductase
VKKVKLIINGIPREIVAGPDMALIDLLREDLHLTGAKQSCDRKGQCGACTVIVDNKAVRSCLKKVIDLDGSKVITVEGLGTPENPHFIQEAFVLTGAIQCGFCTPGMIMATKALLDQNPNPGVTDIKKALARNFCRCTGYKKIIDAVRLAGQFIRGENTPAKVRAAIPAKMLGASHPRPSAMLKACGLARFSADIQFENPLQIAVAHARTFHAKIKSVDYSQAAKMPGVVGIITEKDIKGTNRIREAVPDRPLLCEDVVRSYGDPVVIVAAETREQARAAAEVVRMEFEPLPYYMTPQESLAPGALQIHSHSPNLISTASQIKGNAEKALAESDAVVEAEFSTQVNHQAPLEPEVTVAYKEGEGKDRRVIVIGRSIDIHPVAATLAEAIGCDVSYIEPFVGGQFGIKSTIITEGIAAAAALHFDRPIRYIPSLEESMFLSSKRHPFSMKVKMGANKDGRFTAFYNDMLINKGSYFLLGIITIQRVFSMLSSAYNIPNVYAKARIAYTNNASGAAARGAGPPQSNFAMESVIDMLAEKLGIDQLEFRKKNALKPGDTRSTGAPVEIHNFPEICDAIKPAWEKAKKAAAEFNKNSSGIKRGVGLGAHGFGVGEAGDKGQLYVEVDPDDGITIYAAIAEPGEGNDSMLTQIAAHMLNIPQNKVRLQTRDTRNTVGMGPSAGSRMTYIGGGALEKALEKVNQAMEEAGSRTYAGLIKAGKPTRYEGIKQLKGDGMLDPVTGQGAGFESMVLNIQMAEVEVDTGTGETKVIKMTTAVDAGPIIHPQNLEGQLEGGMDQGIGFALREEYIHGKTRDWITFKFPTIDKAADVEFIFRETPRPNGTLGSTGIGEMTMVSTAPAVTNAIYNACGVRIFDLPATPEKVKAGLSKLKK